MKSKNLITSGKGLWLNDLDLGRKRNYFLCHVQIHCQPLLDFYLEDGMTFKIFQYQTKSKAGFPRALFLPFLHPQNSDLYLETMSSFLERALK